jgi:hypothetical protein
MVPSPGQHLSLGHSRPPVLEVLQAHCSSPSPRENEQHSPLVEILLISVVPLSEAKKALPAPRHPRTLSSSTECVPSS